MIQHRSIITSFFHAWYHVVLCVTSSIITCGNKILHITRRGISHGIYIRVYMTYVIYTVWLLDVEASCDRAWKNRSYLYKIHVFVLWYISPFLCVLSKSVSFIEFLMDLCIYDEILNAIRVTDKKLLHFKLSKSSPISRVDKACFPRCGNIYSQRKWLLIWQVTM